MAGRGSAQLMSITDRHAIFSTLHLLIQSYLNFAKVPTRRAPNIRLLRFLDASSSCRAGRLAGGSSTAAATAAAPLSGASAAATSPPPLRSSPSTITAERRRFLLGACLSAAAVALPLSLSLPLSATRSAAAVRASPAMKLLSRAGLSKGVLVCPASLSGLRSRWRWLSGLLVLGSSSR